MFLLGFVMDAFEIIVVIVPIVAVPLLAMPGIDPVWLGVLLAVNLQTSYMHPPLGPTMFYLRSVAPPELTTKHIYLGVIPFIAIQLMALVGLWFRRSWPLRCRRRCTVPDSRIPSRYRFWDKIIPMQNRSQACVLTARGRRAKPSPS